MYCIVWGKNVKITIKTKFGQFIIKIVRKWAEFNAPADTIHVISAAMLNSSSVAGDLSNVAAAVVKILAGS